MNQKKIICTTVLVETSPQAMPLGAACVASALKADERLRAISPFSVELLDFSREDADFRRAVEEGGEREAARRAAEKIAAQNPFAVCFSVYVWNHSILDECAGFLKEFLPNCATVAGGPEVTADPLNFRNFDYTVAGQGEIAVPELLEKLFSGITDFSIPGVFRKSAVESAVVEQRRNIEAGESGKLKRGGEFSKRVENSVQKRQEVSMNSTSAKNPQILRAVPCRPEDTPSPYLDGTLDPAKYGGALWELARGCPFKCSYCYESKGEKKISYFPMERLERELELFARKKIAQVFVLDPTYNANKARAVQMLRMIESKAPGMFFYFEARAEFIDREIARAFARIPCCVQFGLQSADPEVLKNVHRTLDRRQFARNIGFLNESGVTFGFDLIFGLPGDTLSGFRKSIDFALSLYPNNLELFCLSVLPGTALHDDAPGFGMEWDENPPYHVKKTPTFSENDLKKAALLSEATNLFYTQGRAVPWFNSVLSALRERPSDFLWKFANSAEFRCLGENSADCGFDLSADRQDELNRQKDEIDGKRIAEIQKKFVRKRLSEKKLERLVPVADDLISMHGALGQCTADGTQSEFLTNYHPDDVMSEYATDLQFFARNAGKQKCRVRVFEGKNGADWKTV